MRRPKKVGTSSKIKNKDTMHPLQIEYLERKNKTNENIVEKIDLLVFLKDYLRVNFINYKTTGKFTLFNKAKELTTFNGNIFEFDMQICKFIDQKEIASILLETNGTKEFFRKKEVIEVLKEWQKSDLKMKSLFDKLKIIEQNDKESNFKLDYIQLRIGLHYSNINWNKMI